jgi:beta-glucosidase
MGGECPPVEKIHEFSLRRGTRRGNINNEPKTNAMKSTILPLLITVALLGSAFAPGPTGLGDPPADPWAKKIDSVLALMTLEEKIGQMTLFTSDWDVTGPTLRPTYKEDIRSGRVGAIFNAHTADYVRELQRIAVEETRLGIPLLFGYDVIHGYKTIFPVPLAETASWDLAAIEKAARLAAVEATAAGLHWTFAPMIDIARDPRWGRIVEGSGEDVYLSKLIAAARVRGFQGEDISAPNTLLACAKHFAAYGAAQAGRDYHTVDISDRSLRETYLPPFKAALDAGVRTFMTSFNELDGVPATGNKYLLTDILRDEWGFDGFVVTDYTSINEMVLHGFSRDEQHAGEQAARAGVDMDMQGAVYHRFLAQSVAAGKVDVAQIDQAVRRILRQKFELGLFDDPYRYCDMKRQEAALLAQEHLDFAREIARKSIVLLRNERQTLPLSKDLKTLAVIGPLADNQRELLGSWHGAGNANDCVPLLEGIRQAVGDKTELLYAKGCELTGDNRAGFEPALLAAMKADAVVLAIGEGADMSGEAASRTQLNLPGVQQELAEALIATGKPVVVVLMNGRPLCIPWIAQNAPALLETWFLGTQAGPAIADVLFGDYNPSGKLPVTFPRNEGQIPIHYDMKNTGRPFNANDKYTSKYLDVPNEPLYPFGYGLSYTTFKYANLKLSAPAFKRGEKLGVTVEVSNTGRYDGTETAQLYLRCITGSVTRPVKELKGFQQVFLRPGETRTLRFELSEEDLKFYGLDMQFAAEPGEYEVFVGTNSAEVLAQTVRWE